MSWVSLDPSDRQTALTVTGLHVLLYTVYYYIIVVVIIETRSHWFAQAVAYLLSSSHPPSSASQLPLTRGTYQCAKLTINFF